MRKTIKHLAFLLLLVGLMTGCTEPYALQSNDFESALVVEATITNELKTQTIKLSRAYRLEDEGPAAESGATVFVSDDTGAVYNFTADAGISRRLNLSPHSRERRINCILQRLTGKTTSRAPKRSQPSTRSKTLLRRSKTSTASAVSRSR